MPRFFFSIYDQDGRTDPVAIEHGDFADARQEAVRRLGERLARMPERFDEDAYWRMEVANADGLTLTVVHISEVTAPAIVRKPEV